MKFYFFKLQFVILQPMKSSHKLNFEKIMFAGQGNSKGCCSVVTEQDLSFQFNIL